MSADVDCEAEPLAADALEADELEDVELPPVDAEPALLPPQATSVVARATAAAKHNSLPSLLLIFPSSLSRRGMIAPLHSYSGLNTRYALMLKLSMA